MCHRPEPREVMKRMLSAHPCKVNLKSFAGCVIQIIPSPLPANAPTDPKPAAEVQISPENARQHERRNRHFASARVRALSSAVVVPKVRLSMRP